MLRFLAITVLAASSAALLFTGLLGPLTPGSGLPALEDVLLYAVLPLLLWGVATALTPWKILKGLFSVVMIGGILLIVYVGLSLLQ